LGTWTLWNHRNVVDERSPPIEDIDALWWWTYGFAR